jgi:hypothetical protein
MAQTDLWSFNTTTAVWDYEGSATLAGGAYTVTLPHLSWWNIDHTTNGATCLTGKVVDQNGVAQPGAVVVPYGVGYTLTPESNGAVVGSGQDTYCVWVEPNTQVELSATVGAQAGSIYASAGGGQPYSGPCWGATGCQQVPNIVLGTNETVDAGGLPTCSGPGGSAPDGGQGDAGSPWANTCAAPVEAFASCFAGTGLCTSTGSLSSSATGATVTITFASGSSIAMTGSAAGDSVTFYGPMHQVCGTGSANPTTGSLNLQIPNVPGTFVLSKTSIECPNGQLV